MLQVFKRNDISAYIALLVIAIVCKLKFILHPEIVVIDPNAFDTLFFSLSKWKSLSISNATLFILLSIFVQFVFAIVLNSVMMHHKLFAQNNVLIALSFLFLTSFTPHFNFLSAAFLSNFFLVCAFHSILKLSSTTQQRKWCFNAGFLVSLAVIFYFPAIILVPVLVMFIWLLRPFIFQDLMAYLLGLITPFYFAISFMYLRGIMPQAKSLQATLKAQMVIPHYFSSPAPLAIFLFVGIILLMYSIFLSNKNSYREAMIIRKKWRIVGVYLIFATLAGLFANTFLSSCFIIALTPFSILLSWSFTHRKEKLNIFTFFFLIVSMLTVQWILLK